MLTPSRFTFNIYQCLSTWISQQDIQFGQVSDEKKDESWYDWCLITKSQIWYMQYILNGTWTVLHNITMYVHIFVCNEGQGVHILTKFSQKQIKVLVGEHLDETTEVIVVIKHHVRVTDLPLQPHVLLALLQTILTPTAFYQSQWEKLY